MAAKHSKALTALAVSRMKPGDELADAECRGLRVSKTKSGLRWWYRYNDPETNKQKALVIGHGELSLSEARVAFQKLKEQRRAGMVPETKKPAPKSPTVSGIIADYLQTLERRRTPKAVAEARRILHRCVGDHVGSAQAVKLTVEQCLELANRELEQGHEAQAGVMLRELSAAIQTAQLAGKIPLDHQDPATAARRLLTRGGSRLTSKPRSRFLSDAELRSLLQWLPTSGFSQKQRTALRLALETGARTGEAISARWEHFDLDAGTWHLPKTKTDAPRVIRLSAQSVRWLSVLKEFADSPWLCPSPTTGGHVAQKSLTETMWRMRRDGEQMDWTPHDLRRSVRTGLARLGCPRPVAEAILGHTAGGIVGVYDQHAYEIEAGQWLQRWNDHLDTLRAER